MIIRVESYVFKPGWNQDVFRHAFGRDRPLPSISGVHACWPSKNITLHRGRSMSVDNLAGGQWTTLSTAEPGTPLVSRGHLGEQQTRSNRTHNSITNPPTNPAWVLARYAVHDPGSGAGVCIPSTAQLGSTCPKHLTIHRTGGPPVFFVNMSAGDSGLAWD